MELGKIHKLGRGNRNQTVGLIVKGDKSAVDIYGSQSIPSSLLDMVKCNKTALNEGLSNFPILPEYIVIIGHADKVEIVGASIETFKNIVFPQIWDSIIFPGPLSSKLIDADSNLKDTTELLLSNR